MITEKNSEEARDAEEAAQEQAEAHEEAARPTSGADRRDDDETQVAKPPGRGPKPGES